MMNQMPGLSVHSRGPPVGGAVAVVVQQLRLAGLLVSQEEKMANFVLEVESATGLIDQSKAFIEQGMYNPALEYPTADVDDS